MEIFERSKRASQQLRNITTADKNFALKKVSEEILKNMDSILEENAKDVAIQQEKNVNNALIDRLTLTKARIEGICADMLKVATLPDPVGEVMESWETESGLEIKKVRVPFGVIGVIYEARPNVTVDVFALCLKTSNACLLKGGSDAVHSNEKIVEIIRNALLETAVPQDAVILMPSSRESTAELITAREYVDLIIPRGSKSLINYVVANSKVPCIETGAGVCHTYVTKDADLDEALKILENAKMSRPSVCNACETLIVDKEIAEKFINMVKNAIPTLKLHGEEFGLEPLTQLGYSQEYGDYHLSVKVIDGVKQAVEHINKYGTHHSDCICTKNMNDAEWFLNNVDSACVYLNASTRFSDGGCFGFGAELGISTQKSHARGPMALKEMTSYQYKIYGKGQVR